MSNTHPSQPHDSTNTAGTANGSASGASTSGAASAATSTAKRAGAAFGRAASSAASGTRRVIRQNPTVDKVYRTGVGVVGGGTVALGIVLMPLPGPGTLIALGGLGILATEFDGAKKVSGKANAAAKKAVGAAKAARARRAATRAAARRPAES